MANATQRPDMVPVLKQTCERLRESRGDIARACDELEAARQDALRPRRGSVLLRKVVIR